MDRRTFVSSLAAASAALAVNPRLRGAGSSGRARVGLIGCGWYGGVDLESLAKYAEIDIVSLCDVNARALESTLATVAKYQDAVPGTYADYREMLTATRHDIVVVATPDHWHALPAIAAMKAGADVFLEKPISVDVVEGEALVAAARKYGRVVQVNTQRRSLPLYARARDEFVRSGRLGTIGLVETYCYLPMGRAGVLPDEEPPAHLDYGFWTGPAPMTPFKSVKERGGWRRFMEYGNGIVGDMAVHMFDSARWLLELGWPLEVSSTGGIYVDRESSANITDTQSCVFEYPNLSVTWEHRTWGVSPVRGRHWTDNWGVRLVGEKGTLNLTILGYEFIPADGGAPEAVHLLSPDGDPANADFDNIGLALAMAEEGHAQNFMAARADRSRPVADIGEVHVSSACCILANMALQLGRPLRYDPATRTIPGDDEASALLARPYRAPWVHPTPENV